MKNKLNVTLLTVLAVLFLLPTPSYAQKSKKKNKESFQWVMPPLSGNQIIDEYLKSCDDCWNETLNLTKGLTTYHIDTTYVRADDGNTYKAFSLVDQNGEKRSTSRVILQNIELIMVGTSLGLDMTNIGLGMANVTLELPSLGLKAISYGKHIADGGKILKECGKEVGRIVKVKKAENAAIKLMKQNAISVGEIQSTDKVILNRLDEGEDIPSGVDLALLSELDMGDNNDAVEIDEKTFESAQAVKIEEQKELE